MVGKISTQGCAKLTFAVPGGSEPGENQHLILTYLSNSSRNPGCVCVGGGANIPGAGGETVVFSHQLPDHCVLCCYSHLHQCSMTDLDMGCGMLLLNRYLEKATRDNLVIL